MMTMILKSVVAWPRVNNIRKEVMTKTSSIKTKTSLVILAPLLARNRTKKSLVRNPAKMNQA